MVNTPTTKSLRQPNPDWQVALTYLQTNLPVDLFQKLQFAAEISTFVQECFCRYPELTAEALCWHFDSENDDVWRKLPALFDAFAVEYSSMSEAEVMQALRIFRRSHAAAIAVLELTDTLPIESTSLRISALADQMIKAGYHWCLQSLEQKFGSPMEVCDESTAEEGGRKQNMLILAMGKLGGYELNFSSDVDLIFFFPSAGRTQNGPREIECSRFFQRLATQLIKLLDEVTQDGFVYRVDMRLRPYGDSGALVMSFAQAEEYYQEQGREWERFAMLRARMITGTEQEKNALDDIIRPFSFRRYIDYGVIESIRSMKGMIQREVRRKGLTGNIKLDAGGIREIEFIVQSLQLIQGGRDKRLREKSVLKVLPLLVEAKMLPAEIARDLRDSYRFLRRLEHCIQELAEKQTQQLPESIVEQEALCRALKFDNWLALIAQLDEHQRIVHQHFNDLFGEERQKALSQDDFYYALAEGHVDVASLQQKVLEETKRSFTDDQASGLINQINRFAQDSSVLNLSPRGARRLRTFFPALLAECLAKDCPEKTLDRLLRVLHAILKRTAYLELLSENPPVLQHLVDLAGRSEWIVKRLSEYPILLDELLYPNSLYEPLQASDLQSELRQNLLRIDAEDEEEILDALRAFKQINELRVAAALLAETLSISQVSRYLTQLAEVILNAAIQLCWNIISARYGMPESLSEHSSSESFERCGFAVVGYGKLGGKELGFGSDLDLVFLFDQPVDGQTNGKRALNNSRFYTRFAQKLIHFLSTRTNLGLLYEVDMRLRPSGSSGLLVSHFDAYRDYQLESAWTWEHQALVRARYVAGDQTLQRRFESIREEVLGKSRNETKLSNDVLEMRHKMRGQLEKKEVGKVDLKQAAGGMVDIEFLAQYLILKHFSLSDNHGVSEKSKVEMHIPHNMADCLKLAQHQQIIPQDDGLILVKNYRRFRNKLNELALLNKSSLVGADEFESEMNSVKRIWQKYLPES
ncbi:bifunctional [glutamate--ammonia ligase]-adenylyl-L-tyrosine phosphorylase/[glutamate--ammonia-ligase] adenylyltransferase [Aliikangiella coralliicola]|uniref:Bifunctional glutamine synthetase adenylyltransferase/adenylyl-removing enzyme n=1 Tax=Aliikangiella coralliicola TaxID=2592383 RepID=A0A545UDZ3_9GAMM|nr:bifunctional [glutamate--ammonia ligase]-adenylyl-L-tyrosine phosphorylase/[glutamate--ammonia-ligase] adenylyltransferase [Aliikangiella coralliicola]TQV87681.1 bifunctional [glutamate--ammonia ligase]-adenylyl-L-tyrosine phosphorylase/[glutamate--ammonia-ligase] adenylyltransferase [Aliikangiella coralliicola]